MVSLLVLKQESLVANGWVIEDTSDKSYSYGRWGSNSVNGIPTSQYTKIYEDIFDQFTTEKIFW